MSTARSISSRKALQGWLLALCLMVVCAGQASGQVQSRVNVQVQVHDDRGRLIELRAAPQRIVSLLPSLTESICALGACARLVGTDRYSNAPASVAALPKLGGLEDAQIERIVALKPDVVLAAPSTRAVGRLEALGLKVVVLESRSHADVQRSLKQLAALLGKPEAGDRVWQGIELELQQAQALVPLAVRGKKVYFEVAAAPYAAGEASFIGETLTRLGLGHAVPAALGPFPKLNPEFVVRMQPDVVMASSRNLGDMLGRPGWGSLRALQQKRTCGFEPEAYEVLIRPGPRLGEAALVMARCLAALEPKL